MEPTHTAYATPAVSPYMPEGHHHLHSSNHTNSQDKTHVNTINMNTGVDVVNEEVDVAVETEDVGTPHMGHHQWRQWTYHTRKEHFFPHHRNITNM